MGDEFDADNAGSAGRGGLGLLMVEDQRFDAMLLRKQLASPSIGAGRVDHAETLAGAIDAMQNHDYDAVLLDLGLADSEGVAAVHTLRERFPEVVVIVLTGRDEEQLGIEAMAAGAQDMLIKGSFDTEALGRALHYAIERQRLESGVRQSSEEHRTLFENNPFPVFVYDSYTLRFLAVNEASTREYGYSRDEFMRMSIIDLLPPDLQQRAMDSIEAARGGGLVSEDWKHRRKDGSTFDVEANGQPLDFRGRRARIVLVRDITVRKRVIRALERSEGRFRNLFEHSLGLICTHDLDGVLISVNSAVARALDYSIGDLLGRNLADLIPVENRHEFASYLQRVRENGRDSGLLPVISRGGDVRVWQYNNMLDSDGDEPFVLGHAQDITERRNYERRLRELSTIDPLTGSHNRRFLDEHAQSLVDSRWGCILVDLDRFKRVNDVHGHERGDQVLIAVAAFLRKHAPRDAIVVRMGGDEFLLVTKDATDTSVAALADAMRNDARGSPIGFTLGCAVREGTEALDATIGRADQALYAARAAARDGGAAEQDR